MMGNDLGSPACGTQGVKKFVVERAEVCRFEVMDGAWPFAADRAAEIDAHWEKRRVENPEMFNGVIHIMRGGRHAGGRFEAKFVRTDFKSYLYWREMGFPEAGAIDCFGSALIRSAEGYVVLGRQRAGNVNGGLAYLPGGFIDHRDVAADGTIDIDASIYRELAEETGLLESELTANPGYILTRHGALLAVTREVVSALPAQAVRDRILAHIADDPKSELTDAVIVRSTADINEAAMHPYARQLLEWHLAGS